MIQLKVTQCRTNNEYVLVNNQTNITYNFVLEFFKVEKPKIGDILLLHEDLLNFKSEHYSNMYSFKLLYKTREDINKLITNEIACLISNNENIILKRIYG